MHRSGSHSSSPHADALMILRTLAGNSPLIEARGPIQFAGAHGCLDVLGALEAEGGGTLAQMVLPGQVAVAVQPRTDGKLVAQSGQIGPPVGEGAVMLPVGEWAALSNGGWEKQVLALAGTGAAWAGGMVALACGMHRLAAGNGLTGGATVLVHGDLPIGAGQATSTAMLAALARVWGHQLHLPTDALSLARYAAGAEAVVGASHLPPPPPSRGHIIDGLTSLHPRTRRPVLLRYSAQPHKFVGMVPLPGNVRVFALDTGVRYSATRCTLEELRVAAAMGVRIIETIYRDLGQAHTPLHGYLTNTSPLLYRQYFRALLPKRLRGSDFVRTYGPLPADSIQVGPEQLDSPRLYRVRTAVDHLIAENEHAEQFLQAMEELADAESGELEMDEAEKARTLQRAGRLLLASHHSYRLRLELSCREADWLVDCLMESGPEKGVYGARITGCGGGGTVVALLDKSTAAMDVLLGAIKSYHQLTGLSLGVVEV